MSQFEFVRNLEAPHGPLSVVNRFHASGCEVFSVSGTIRVVTLPEIIRINMGNTEPELNENVWKDAQMLHFG